MSPLSFPDRIRYEFLEDAKVKLQYAHGVWGGINPQGEIEINFYLESDKIPTYSERKVEPDGILGLETAPFNEDERVVVRYIHSRVVVNYQTARALLEWLDEKLDSMDVEDEAVGPLSFDGVSGFEQ